MTWLLRLVSAHYAVRCLSMATLLVAASIAPGHSIAAGAAHANDPIAAGPASWSDDLSPIAASDWSEDRAAHLIERAGFGATPEDVKRLAAMKPQQVVDELVDYESIQSGLNSFDESGIWDPGMDPFPPSRAEAVRLARLHGEGLGVKILAQGSQRRSRGLSTNSSIA